MAKEISRTFDKQSGSVVVIIEDDDGIQTPHTIYVFNKDSCPTCGHVPVVAPDTGVDVEATISKIMADIDDYHQKWQTKIKPRKK